MKDHNHKINIFKGKRATTKRTVLSLFAALMLTVQMAGVPAIAYANDGEQAGEVATASSQSNSSSSSSSSAHSDGTSETMTTTSSESSTETSGDAEASAAGSSSASGEAETDNTQVESGSGSATAASSESNEGGNAESSSAAAGASQSTATEGGTETESSNASASAAQTSGDAGASSSGASASEGNAENDASSSEAGSGASSAAAADSGDEGSAEASAAGAGSASSSVSEESTESSASGASAAATQSSGDGSASASGSGAGGASGTNGEDNSNASAESSSSTSVQTGDGATSTSESAASSGEANSSSHGGSSSSTATSTASGDNATASSSASTDGTSASSTSQTDNTYADSSAGSDGASSHAETDCTKATAAAGGGQASSTASVGHCDDDDDDDHEPKKGSIRVCKIIVDEEGNIIDGSSVSTTFSLTNVAHQGAAGAFPSVSFTTPLDVNVDLVASSSPDGECQTYDNLVIGEYFYSEETISGEGSWEQPLYNDQFSHTASDLDDFFAYDDALFDGDGGNDGSRNRNADGQIILTEDRANRTLIVLNELVDDGDDDDDDKGSIRICKIILDENGHVTIGDGLDTSFTIASLAFNDAVGVFATTTLIAPLSPNADIISSSTPEAECVTHHDLPFGAYYYDEESITGDGEWELPRYNDVYNGSVLGPNDFSHYSPELFDNDSQNDNARNIGSDGQMVLTPNQPDQTLVVLNQLKDGGDDGEPTPECSDTVDNDGDGLIDAHDPGCHTDGDPDNFNSYDPDDDSEEDDQKDNGTVRVCKVVLDENGDVFYGEGVATSSFTVNLALQGDGASQGTQVQFSSPLTLNTNLFGDSALDARCLNATTTLPFGTYTYSENIGGDGASLWDTPRFHDSFEAGTSTLAEALVLGTTTPHADGDLKLSSSTPSVTLLVVNTLSDDNGGTPAQCADDADNDGDNLVDENDPGCHTDGDPNNPNSYDPNDDSENQKPTITLLGDNPLTLTVGSTFTDPGATANDPEDGDITDDIVVGGDTVATNTPATYQITYNVTDSDGAAADEVIRTVTVQATTTPPTDDDDDDDNGGGGGGGGGSSGQKLIIRNEAVQVLEPGVALVTWETNLPATSRVVFDTQSHDPLTNAHHDDDNLLYQRSTALSSTLVTDHSVIVTSVDLTQTHYFRPISTDSRRFAVGRELIADIDTAVGGGVCPQYLIEFIQVGANNNPDEVVKLQTFLRDFEGHSLAITGIYDQATINAVDEFQEKYFNDVLEPWGHDAATSFVYLTTRKKINEIYCAGARTFPLTETQAREVEAFRALLESLREQGAPLPDTSGIGAAVEEQDEEGATEENEEIVELGGTSTEEGVVGRTQAATAGFVQGIWNGLKGVLIGISDIF